MWGRRLLFMLLYSSGSMSAPVNTCQASDRKTAPVIPPAPPISEVENIFTSYVTYLTATVIFTNNTIRPTSTRDVYSKVKMNPARWHQAKTKRYVSEIFIVTFDLCHLQSMDKTEVLIYKKNRNKNKIRENLQWNLLHLSTDHYRVTEEKPN